jgi:hypothetical protein
MTELPLPKIYGHTSLMMFMITAAIPVMFTASLISMRAATHTVINRDQQTTRQRRSYQKQNCQFTCDFTGFTL